MTEVKANKTLVYDVHVFCCINERPDDAPRTCCAAGGSKDLHAYLKARSKELKIRRIRINKAGCLNRCELGPVMVIYPEAVWYRYDSEADVEEILQSHIIGGVTVNRLLV